MSQPPYITIMMLNPVQSAIMDFRESCPKCESPEEKPLVPETTNQDSEPNVFVPKQRFGLFLWFVVVVLNFSSWFTFSSALPITHAYYQIDLLRASFIFMAAPVVLVIMTPLLHKHLEKDVDHLLLPIFAAFFNAIGAGIKCRGTNRNDFWSLFTGQLFIYVSLAFSLGFPLAFHKQVKSSNNFLCYLGFAAAGLGCGSGILIPLFVISSKSSMTEVGWQIYRIFLWNAVISTCVLIVLPFALKEQKRKKGTIYQSSNNNTSAANTGQHRGEGSVEAAPMRNDCGLSEESKSFFTQLTPFLTNVQRLNFLLRAGLSYAVFITTFSAWPMLFNSDLYLMKQAGILGTAAVFMCLVSILLTVKCRMRYPKWLLLLMIGLSLASIIAFAIIKNHSSQAVAVSFLSLLHIFASFYMVASISQGAKYLPSPRRILFTSFVFQLLTAATGVAAVFLLEKLGFYAWSVFVSFVCFLILCLTLCT